ncbi:hypothetical protein F4679DRAFT_449246 [Xylaria curta]|nr:hypothetical protein F4679DRAFT_449246 [Xylaria curta]
MLAHGPAQRVVGKFYCLCGKGFTRKHNLNNHIGASDNVRPYTCDVKGCERSFLRKSDLKSHKKTHTGERPYKCGGSGCGASFLKKNNLKRHMETCRNQAKSVRTSSMRTGSVRTGSVRTSSIQTSSMRPGSMRPGSMRPGSVQTGSMRPGPIQTGSMQTQYRDLEHNARDDIKQLELLKEDLNDLDRKVYYAMISEIEFIYEMRNIIGEYLDCLCIAALRIQKEGGHNLAEHTSLATFIRNRPWHMRPDLREAGFAKYSGGPQIVDLHLLTTDIKEFCYFVTNELKHYEARFQSKARFQGEARFQHEGWPGGPPNSFGLVGRGRNNHSTGRYHPEMRGR